ncbi:MULTISPECIES: alpha/beta fold hydrolase [Pseudoalteromonas]|nr:MULTISPECIES: alpha/beta fold hydrolase [Pseudoalteromonas]MCG7563274.1 alpha/beta fold hydrolase [Pseudoalteromonas sp. McH1-42]MEC4090370.1 alpha/beta fold hydrolase [Pseudoalteromonas rubra]
MNASTSYKSKWLRVFQPRPDASCRIFCFPYAGSGPAVYKDWGNLLPPDIEVVAIHYPGRESRSDELLLTDLIELVEQLRKQILPYLDKPFVFFGHSMGAYIAFELTRALWKCAGVRPDSLFISAAGAPHIREPNCISDLSYKEFLRALLKLNGIPSEVLKNPELITYALPILRSDMRICESYTCQTIEPLEVPMTVFGGTQDKRISFERLEKWQLHAATTYKLEMYDGDHFFINTQRRKIIDAINKELLALI